MTTELQPPVALSSPHPRPGAATDDERWNVWVAKGAAHDRTVRRRMRIVLPLLAVVGGVVSYVLFGY